MQIVSRIVNFHVANKESREILVQPPHGTLVVRRACGHLLKLGRPLGLCIALAPSGSELLCEPRNLVFQLLHAPIRRGRTGPCVFLALELAQPVLSVLGTLFPSIERLCHVWN